MQVIKAQTDVTNSALREAVDQLTAALMTRKIKKEDMEWLR